MDSKVLKPFAVEGYNVLLSGKHGVGKTALIKEVFGEVFGEFDKNWKYFSASTLDPWVDFIGIPKNYTNSNGEEVFKIIPPESFTGSENIQALFFDEINRADEKVLNALMELIQFRSINGRKFPNLKCVWAAENPHDDEQHHYAVHPLDPAQKDRFNIQLNVPYYLNEKYFVDKYGEEYFRVAKKWWTKSKDVISPRKLDDMIGGFIKGFDVSLFSNICGTTKELQTNLEGVNIIQAMESASKSGDVKKIKEKFSLRNIRKYEKNIKSIKKQQEFFKNAMEHMDEETLAYVESNFRVISQGRNSIGVSLESMEELSSIGDGNPFYPENITLPSRERRYIAKFASLFHPYVGEVMDFGATLGTFDFVFIENNFGPQSMKSMANAFESDYSMRENFKQFIATALYVSYNMRNGHKTDLFLCVSKMMRSNTLKKALKTNNIRLNAILKATNANKKNPNIVNSYFSINKLFV